MWKIGFITLLILCREWSHINSGIVLIGCYVIGRLISCLLLFLFGQPTTFFMRVDDAYGLEIGIDDGAAHKFHSPFPQVFLIWHLTTESWQVLSHTQSYHQ